MSNLRKELHDLIEIHGLDYDKVIEKDRELHNEIIETQRAMMKKYKN